jgi:hypothetical protein
VATLFYILQEKKEAWKKDTCFSMPTLRGANVAPTSHVRMTAMSVLMLAGN